MRYPYIYPDPESRRLGAALAEDSGLGSDYIQVGCGADEQTDLTLRICDDETLSKILKLPIPVILDEAYKGYSTKMTCMKKFENLNVLPTFSKSDGIDHAHVRQRDESGGIGAQPLDADANRPRQSPADETNRSTDDRADRNADDGANCRRDDSDADDDANRLRDNSNADDGANRPRDDSNSDPESGITRAPNDKLPVHLIVVFLGELMGGLLNLGLTHSSKHSWVNYFKWIGVLIGFGIGVAGFGMRRYKRTLGEYVMKGGAMVSVNAIIITLISSLPLKLALPGAVVACTLVNIGLALM